jgi:fumarate reductase flavoprotein subunit
VEARPNAQLITDAPAIGLVADEAGAVRGVVVERDGGRERIRCRKVVLACNGFAANREMVARHCPEMVGALYFGGEGNTGEGIRWGQALGGAVAFMDYQPRLGRRPHGI